MTTAVETKGEQVPSVRTGERRDGPDRRQQPTPMFSRYMLFGGRRSKLRRLREREGSFVDRYGLRVCAIVLAIILLNLADAWFTLYFLSEGGEELNPFVQIVLDLGGHPYPFLWLKTVGIGLLCAFLLMTKNFKSARLGMWFVFGGYVVLLGWHLYLFRQLQLVS